MTCCVSVASRPPNSRGKPMQDHPASPRRRSPARRSPRRGRQDVIEARSLWELVERRAAATPDALFAVDDENRSLGFAAYRDAALRCAAGLAALGLRAGMNVSWQLPTRIDSMVLAAALARP